MTLQEKIKFIDEFETHYYVWQSEGHYCGIILMTAKKLIDEMKKEINYFKIKNP
jgi:hypothetical protein